MNEPGARLWDAAAKMITALGLVVGGLWTVWKYFDARKKEKLLERDSQEKERQLARERAQSAEVEARKPFSSRQLGLYFDVVECVSRLALTSRSAPEFNSLCDTFWHLYWGSLALVEDQKVATAMVGFGEALKGGSEEAELQPRALELAHACRDSLAESWKVSLPTIERNS
jgi:hypothetical protein